jgi:hypothetical protein
MSTRRGSDTSTRRRIYLLRHAEVAYFDEAGRPLVPDDVPLTRPAAARPGRPPRPWPGCASTGS